jgi:hypothetical protein
MADALRAAKAPHRSRAPRRFDLGQCPAAGRRASSATLVTTVLLKLLRAGGAATGVPRRLYVVHRRKRHLLPAALPRARGYAAALRRLSGCIRGLELRVLAGVVPVRRGPRDLRREYDSRIPAQTAGGRQSMGPGATSLEWTLPSSPPFHQFEVLPRVK